MKKRTFTQRDYIKANRRASRLAKIENHSRPVSIAGVHKSKKVYDRKRVKAEIKKALPYLFLLDFCECFMNMLQFDSTSLYPIGDIHNLNRQFIPFGVYSW